MPRPTWKKSPNTSPGTTRPGRLPLIAELEAKCRAVAETPDLYPARTDLAPGLRMAVHGRYLLLYRDLPERSTVRVERVLHGARNLPRLL
ncbi:MAG TPA: type II toxin-antitoxin system RelE/ParE family toxin [Acetobacteraceae bacterium]|nr:type II toxin-antitoxin system RelE/ParE family toxin [Acetobacteraceae bacterium]